MFNPSIFLRNCSAILTPSLRFESMDCLNMIMLKMVEAITGMTRTYRSFSIPIPRAVHRHLSGTLKNGGCPPADTVGQFLAFKYEIRMPPRSFEMVHPIS